jgi:hypothetical protein
MEENNIKVFDDKVEVVYTSGGAGCLLFSGGSMTLTGLFILFYIVPDSNIVRGFIGIIIGTIGLLFSGTMFLKVLGAILSGKAVYTVQEGYFEGKKKSVRISEITDMKWAGSSLKYLAVKTTDKKTTKLSSYNLVPVGKVNQVIEEYVVPNATEELKQNWAKRNKEA